VFGAGVGLLRRARRKPHLLDLEQDRALRAALASQIKLLVPRRHSAEAIETLSRGERADLARRWT
jgi:hypothetical protein